MKKIKFYSIQILGIPFNLFFLGLIKLGELGQYYFDEIYPSINKWIRK